MVTKRYSPFQNSMVDTKLTDSFAKWSKMFPMISPPQKKRRAIILLDEPNKQDQLNKRLHRRAIYIPPSDILDGPQDTQQKWSLYRATQQKLRRNSLPLLESIHLQKMLVTLLDDEHVRAMQTSITARIKQSQEDEDDIPLGTLIHKKANLNHITSFPIRFA